jgi:putative FmdB family regulatory protein
MSWQSISLSASETRSQSSATNDEESPMPTYQYRCTECGTDLEAVQKFSDPALTECPTCHGSLRKVFNAVGVVFKGSGFYRTDSRPKEGASNGSNGSSSGSGETKVKDAAGNGSSEKKSSDSGSTSNGSGSNGSKSDTKTPATSSSSSSTGSGSTS